MPSLARVSRINVLTAIRDHDLQGADAFCKALGFDGPMDEVLIERFRSGGYDVVILDEGAEKEISGIDVREAMRDGRDWRPLVPPGVARVIEGLERAPALTS